MISARNLTMVHPYTGKTFDACIKVVNIHWDLDGDDEDMRQHLPTEMLVRTTYEDTEEGVDELFCDKITECLSDETGWCVDHFDVDAIIQVECKERR